MSGSGDKSGGHLPGKGMWGWLGRQLGHVGKAIVTDVPDPAPVSQTAETVYRDARVEEHPHPTDPNVVLRRTTIDEAVARKPGNTPE